MNYIKEYFANKGLFAEVFSGDVKNEALNNAKIQVDVLRKQLEEKEEALKGEYKKIYSEHFVPTKKHNILKYVPRTGDIKYFDITSGVPKDINSYNIDELNIIDAADGLRGKILIVSGYIYERAAIIIERYGYSINSAKTKLTTNFNGYYLVDFIDGKISCYSYNPIDKEFYKSNEYDNDYKLYESLSYKDNDFINTLFSSDYKGQMTIAELKNRYRNNKSFEIIIKTCDDSIMDKLLSLDVKEAIPVHKIISLTKEGYEILSEKGFLEQYVQFIKDIEDYSSGYNTEPLEWKTILKNEADIIKYFEEINAAKSDLDFYNIKIGRYSYEKYTLEFYLLREYLKKDNSVFRDGYNFKNFVRYVTEHTVQQGFGSVNDFIIELKDYIAICKEEGSEPVYETRSLRQNHDIVVRNHKVTIEKEMDQKFKERYKDFKPYRNNKKGYMIIAPSCSRELIKEGDDLSHCVGSYVKNVADGKCLILFLRKEAKKSLVTMELRNKSIVQVKGAHNRAPNSEELSVIRDFCEKNEYKLEI